jgi:hypothetical protein
VTLDLFDFFEVYMKKEYLAGEELQPPKTLQSGADLKNSFT